MGSQPDSLSTSTTDEAKPSTNQGKKEQSSSQPDSLSTSTTDEAKPSTNQGKKEQSSTQPESLSTKPESSSTTNRGLATEKPESSTNTCEQEEEELYDPSAPIVLDPPIKLDTIRRLQLVTA